MSKKILYIVNDISFFVSHRLEIALSAKKEGLQIHLAYPRADSKLEQTLKGFKHHPINLTRSGRNPLKEILAFVSMYRVIKQVNPDKFTIEAKGRLITTDNPLQQVRKCTYALIDMLKNDYYLIHYNAESLIGGWKEYIKYIEELIETPVSIISTGPKREDIIVR